MDQYVGIDVSLEQSSVCVVDAAGQVVVEAKVSSTPESLSGFLLGLGLSGARVGLEAGPLSQWLHAGLVASGFEAVLLETRHVKAALSAMVVKTDRKDARGIAHLLRMGWYRPVHCKSSTAQEVRSLLSARRLLLAKAIDVELGLRGLLRGFGLKLGRVGKAGFAARVRELAAGQAMLESVVEAMLLAREMLRRQVAVLHRQVLDLVRRDPVCRRLMTVPGVGPVVALSYTSSVDDPSRFGSSKTLGAYFGLTPRRYQSGETDIGGRISRVGDGMVRTALYEAAQVMLTRSHAFSSLKRWALEVAKRRGRKRAIVALARKLACVLHRMWLDGSEFRYTKPSAA